MNENNTPLDPTQRPDENRSEPAQEASSTIFSAPAAHRDKKKTRSPMLKRVVAAVLAVAVLCGGIVAVVKLIPKKESEDLSLMQSYPVYTFRTDAVTDMQVAWGDTLLHLEGYDDDTGAHTWRLLGNDSGLIDPEALQLLVETVTNMGAYKEYAISDVKTDGADYGLVEPAVWVTFSGPEIELTEVRFGGSAGDGSYVYLWSSCVPTKVLVVPSTLMSTMQKTPFDLVYSTGVPALTAAQASASYFDSDGVLDTFDTLTLSGKALGTTITFIPNTTDTFSSYAAYITTTPKSRIAAKAEDLMDLFGKGISTSGLACFTKEPEDLARFGLDDPDYAVSIKLADKAFEIRVNKYEGNYYLAADYCEGIRGVAETAVSFVRYSEKDFYTLVLILENISDISRLSFNGDVTATFDIERDEENETYNISVGGKAVNADAFQSAYGDWISTSAVDLTTVEARDTSLKVNVVHKDGSPDTVLTFSKVGETRYQYTVGGEPMGQITSSAYNKFTRAFNKVIP